MLVSEWAGVQLPRKITIFILVKLMMITRATNSPLFFCLVGNLQRTHFRSLWWVLYGWNDSFFTPHKHVKCLLWRWLRGYSNNVTSLFYFFDFPLWPHFFPSLWLGSIRGQTDAVGRYIVENIAQVIGLKTFWRPICDGGRYQQRLATYCFTILFGLSDSEQWLCMSFIVTGLVGCDYGAGNRLSWLQDGTVLGVIVGCAHTNLYSHGTSSSCWSLYTLW